MKSVLLTTIILIFIGSAQAANDKITVVTYHEVVQDVGKDSYAVSKTNFIEHMDFIRDHGYTPVSLKLIEKVRQGKAKLPSKPVLLTFDDGYMSYYNTVVPILRTYEYPSVAAVVTAWLDGRYIPPEYRGKGKLMNWQHIKKLAKSNLVEIASHSDNLHRGLPSNPQGNERAAAITRAYDPIEDTYEDDSTYRLRVKNDLARSAHLLSQKLGRFPLAIVWPYGEYNQHVVDEAVKIGFKYHMTLDDGPAHLSKLPHTHRIMMVNNPDGYWFGKELRHEVLVKPKHRFVELSLEPFLGKDRNKQEAILGRLLDRVQAIKVNTVIISPFTQDFKRTYFFTKQMPVATDVLNRTTHQLFTRLQDTVQFVFIRVPKKVNATSPTKLYTDLSRIVAFNGVVFDADIDPRYAADIKRAVNYNLPNVKYGTEGVPAISELKPEFVIYSLNANAPKQKMTQLLATLKNLPYQAFVSLDRIQGVKDEILSDRLRYLRSYGIKHFGYRYDDYLSEKPKQGLVTQTFSASTLTPNGG